MINKFPIYKRGEINKVFDKLPERERKAIISYVKYRSIRTKSLNKLEDIKRTITQFRQILNKEFSKINLKDLRDFLALLGSSERQNSSQNDFKANIQNFLKWKFKNWSLKFSNFEDISFDTNLRNEEKLNSKVLLSKEDIEKIMAHETKIFWKAFFMVQYEAGLRTIEVRTLKWSDLKFNVDGNLSEVNIYATKTKKARTIFVKEATFYLLKLKEEQENKQDKGELIFHSKKDINEMMDKGTISSWMRNLSQNALGRKVWSYILRHSRATELYRLAKQNKIANDTATSFMGHSKDMSKFYTHLDTEEIKKMLKEQVYKLNVLSPKEKEKITELEKEIQELKKNSISKQDVIKLVENALMKITG